MKRKKKRELGTDNTLFCNEDMNFSTFAVNELIIRRDTQVKKKKSDI